METGVLAKPRDRQSEGPGEGGAVEHHSHAGVEDTKAVQQRAVPGERARGVGDVASDRQRVGAGRDEPVRAADDRAVEGRRVLIPAFEAVGPDGIRRDSFGRALDEGSIAAAVDRDADVRRERQARSIYLEAAYRDPKIATQRLDDIIARDGATSAAQRVSADVGLLGELRGRDGFFAGARARDERDGAERAAAAIGPNVARTAEFENRAAQVFRADIERQMKADAVEVMDVSDRAKAALARVTGAKDDREQAEAFKALSADPEIATFRKSIEARFGDEGARDMARAVAVGRASEHPSVAPAQQTRLDEAAKVYSVARHVEHMQTQHAEAERLTAQESQSARLKQ